MKKKFILLASLVFMFSCGNEKKVDNLADLASKSEGAIGTSLAVNPKNQLLDAVKKSEDTLFKSEVLDRNLGNQAIKNYNNFITAFPADSLSPYFLYKAAEIADNLNNLQAALLYYNNCYEKYPFFPMSVECLFRQANIYEFKLKEISKAKDIYTTIVEEYPKHALANDARALLKNMGKSDVELVREFEKKNKIKK